MAIVRIDLRDRDTRARLKASPPPTPIDSFPFAEGQAVAALPIRVLLILPVDLISTGDYEDLALKLLGSDPSPRAVVLLVDAGGLEGRRPVVGGRPITRMLPAELARGAQARFLDLRSSTLSIGHPRTGLTQVSGDDDREWARAFVRDLIAQLSQVDIFDAVWASIPSDRPATMGMRVAALGPGRERAVADLALRLAEELRPDREPYMGNRLPDRWKLDPRLLPASPPYPVAAGAADALPPAARGLAAVPNTRLIRLLSRRPSTYNEGVETVRGILDDRPVELADRLRKAQRVGDDGPAIDPIGAAELDHALGGSLFGDDLARAAEVEGDDPASRVGEQLVLAAERQAEGLSAALLAHWLRTDADRVAPIGPAAAAAQLVDGDRPWKRKVAELDATGPARSARDWIQDALGERLAAARPRSVPAAEAPGEAPAQSSPPPAESGSAPGGAQAPIRPLWELPRRLGWILGSPVWRPPLRWLVVLLTLVLAVFVAVQTWADLTSTYLFDTGGMRVIGLPLSVYQAILTALAWLLALYLIAGLIVAIAVRRWAKQFGFEQVPAMYEQLEGEARALAVAEVARFAVRRDYARVAREAADTLEQGARAGADVARQFGEQLEAQHPQVTDELRRHIPPHRELLPSEETVAGTDAGGIYRVYPLYVSALRSLFAASLARAVRERWPRIRGVFWTEARESISRLAAITLQRRLEDVLDFGLRRGDLEHDGVDPADELAERLWATEAIRERAMRALHIDPDDPLPMLATPSDTRLLDQDAPADLILAIPATLEPLVLATMGKGAIRVITGNVLESATALRVFPFQPGIYDFVEADVSEEWRRVG